MMKEPHSSSKHHILIKLEMARSGQGWRRLKICPASLSAKIRSRGSSCRILGVTESRTPKIATIRLLMSVPNMAPACQESGLRRGLSASASLSFAPWCPPPLPLLIVFPAPVPLWCCFFSIFCSSLCLFISLPPLLLHLYSCPPSSSFISSIFFIDFFLTISFFIIFF